MSAYRRRRWREAMTVRLDLNGLLGGAPGSRGLVPATLEALAPALRAVRAELRVRRDRGGLGFAALGQLSDGVEAVRALARDLAEEFDTLVVLGVGGTSQGVRLLVEALRVDDGMRVIVSDSIDPTALSALLGRVELARTVFNVVSKSGDTAETVAQFLVVRDRLLRDRGAVDYKRHLVITTDPERGSLRQIVNDEGFRALSFPSGVYGPFAVLGPPGLFPAACAGVDLEALLAGAGYAEERLAHIDEPLRDPTLALAGALIMLGVARDVRSLVVMPYAERLNALAEWFAACWNESVVKAVSRDDQPIAVRPTAVRARGSSDRYAQLQSYLEGRGDKVTLFFRVEDHGEAIAIPAAYQDLETVGCLGGAALGTLLNGQQQILELALGRHGRASATVVLPVVNSFTVGQLVYMLEWTAVAAALLAGVEPFGHPASDDLRQYTYGLLGRPGFEARRAELEAWLAGKDSRLVL